MFACLEAGRHEVRLVRHEGAIDEPSEHRRNGRARSRIASARDHGSRRTGAVSGSTKPAEADSRSGAASGGTDPGARPPDGGARPKGERRGEAGG